MPSPRPTEGPTCPKGCDVATPPRPADRPGRWVCDACGHEFPWPP